MPLESKPFEVPMAVAVNRAFGLIAPGFDLYDLQAVQSTLLPLRQVVTLDPSRPLILLKLCLCKEFLGI